MNKPLKIPTETAASSPKASQAWLDYWRSAKTSTVNSMTPERRQSYNRQYNAARTKQRQIFKMIELVNKYPEELQYYLYPETRPQPRAKDMYPLGR